AVWPVLEGSHLVPHSVDPKPECNAVFQGLGFGLLGSSCAERLGANRRRQSDEFSTFHNDRLCIDTQTNRGLLSSSNILHELCSNTWPVGSVKAQINTLGLPLLLLLLMAREGRLWAEWLGQRTGIGRTHV